MKKRIRILGAGPTGLGAAYRLQEKGYDDWRLYERTGRVGGLSASFTDEEGFTWDQGGHVVFSHYRYFDDLVEKLLRNKYTQRIRESWIRLLDRWIPYPFQNNIRYLPAEEILRCLEGLYKARKQCKENRNFREWILATFGDGIADLFMLPYNYKVWATPPELMDKNWIAERVSVIDFERILENVLLKKDDVGWGPNSTFKYPEKGGTGGLFDAFVPYVEKHLSFHKELVAIDVDSRVLRFSDGSKDHYDILISTIPLDRLVRAIRPEKPSLLKQAAKLKHNSVYAVGIGVKKPTEGTRCWMYFPERNAPFYRVTNLSYYSPWNVPDGDSGRYSSFLCEISYSEYRPENKADLVDRTIDGLVRCGLLKTGDKNLIVSRWLHEIDYAYPVPTLERDKALASIQPVLHAKGIYSRGRFGAWRYEIANMDHSVMMGVEVVDGILEGRLEPTIGYAPERGIPAIEEVEA